MTHTHDEILPQHGVAPTAPHVAPAAKRSKAAIVFAILAVVFLLGLGAMTVLFLVQKSDAETTATDQRARIETLTRDAAANAERLTKAEQDLTVARKDADDAEACVTAVRSFFNALHANDEAAGQAAVLALASRCEGVSLLG